VTAKTIIMAIALLLGETPAVFAQSAYTSGTADSSAAAGYPTPYSGAGIYAYVPRYGQVYNAHRDWRRR
jgi:hypothetical protein